MLIFFFILLNLQQQLLDAPSCCHDDEHVAPACILLVNLFFNLIVFLIIKFNIMSIFGDIKKTHNIIDESLNTVLNRYCLCAHGSVMISESVHLAALYQRNTFNPIRSWSFPQLKQLTCPVVYDRKNANIITVQREKWLCAWPVGEAQERETMRCSFDVPLVGAIYVDNIGIVVVFHNGFCQIINDKTFEDDIQDKTDIISPEELIINIYACRGQKDFVNIYLCTKVKGKEETEKSIYFITVNCKTGENEVVGKPIQHDNDFWLFNPILKCFVGTKQQNHLSLNVFNENLNKKMLNFDSTLIKTLYGMALNENYENLLLIGETTQTETYICELWNFKYGFKVGEISLPDKPLKNDCNIVNSNVYITCTKGMFMIPILVKDYPLSKVIGKGKSMIDTNLLSPFAQIEEVCKLIQVDESNDSKSIEQFYALVCQFTQMKLYVPEKTIVLMLMTCLDQLGKDKNNSKFLSILHSIITLPFHETSLIENLKSYTMNFENFCLAINLLFDLIPSKCYPAIDWISVLFDTFLNELLTNQRENSCEFMQELGEKVDNLIKYYDGLNKINNILECYIFHETKSQQQNELKYLIGQYSIEYLKF